jgi:hypothetical protein
MRENILPNLKIPVKKNALVIIFDIRLKMYYTLIKKEISFFEKVGFKEDEELIQYILDMTTTILDKSKSKSLALGIPQQIINSVEERHAPRIEVVNSMIRDILLSKLNNYTHEQKLLRIFTLIQVALYSGLIDLEKHTVGINGSLNEYFDKFNNRW